MDMSFTGAIVVEAYVAVFGGDTYDNDGFGDKGRDIAFYDGCSFDLPDLKPYWGFEVKASALDSHLKKWAGQCLTFRDFRPICMGEPGTREEIEKSISEFGGWVGKDEPNRSEFLRKIKALRHHVEG